MQIILSKEEQDTFATLLKDIADMKSGLAEIRALLQNNTNPPDIIWPYGNWENCKYTFPDASERPAPDIRKTDFENPYIKFAPDGSIGFDLPEGMDFTPTPNAKYPRIERREYKRIAAKTNFTKGDIITRGFVVIFHKLNLGVADVVWTQMHGEKDPYYKVVAGKNGIRVQCKTKEALSGDDSVRQLLPHTELEYERPYRFVSAFDGATLNIALDGNMFTIPFARTDGYYPKDGAYGPPGASLTHKPA
ncbi:MAG: hypothetical protein IPH06_06800 [Alphaproteobacteria bacterium]|nr:hypothetical protein [Alphaproteobacteria bacterium]QQS57724.1 MAG: hypothetical protein IPN28_02565 [Alphaproteobacteria bacterium]